MTKETAKAIATETLKFQCRKSDNTAWSILSCGIRTGIFYTLDMLEVEREYIYDENNQVIGVIVDGQKVTIEDLEN